MELGAIKLEIYDLVILVGVVAVPVNLLALWILDKNPRVIGEVAGVFHKSLAIVDLLTGLSCLGFGCRIFYRGSPLVAMLATMSTLSFTLSSLLLLLLITLDRLVAIRRPLRHLVVFTIGKAKLYSAILVTSSCLYIVAQTFLSYDGGKSQKFDDAGKFAKLILFCVTAALVLLTVLFLTVMNVLLFVTVLRILRETRNNIPVRRNSIATPRRVRGQDARATQGETTRKSAKFARTVLVMTAAFYVAFIPAIVGVGVHAFGFDIGLPVLHTTFVIMQSNCVSNPFIYLVMNPAFRRVAMKSLFRRCLGSTRGDSRMTGSDAQVQLGSSTIGIPPRIISRPNLTLSQTTINTECSELDVERWSLEER